MHSLRHMSWSAGARKRHVCSGVVALDDHQHQRIMEGEVYAVIQCAQNASPKALVSCLKNNAISRIDLARIYLSVNIDQQRNLDGAHGVHGCVSIDGDFFAGIERLDVNAPVRTHALRNSLKPMFEKIERFGRGSRLRLKAGKKN